jgi:hypothetical protein
MTYTFFTTTSDSEDEDPKYSSFVELEDFEEDPPEGFEGPQKGSSLEESSERGERAGPVPWDPAESFFAYI